jgi:hypothetical protein
MGYWRINSIAPHPKPVESFDEFDECSVVEKDLALNISIRSHTSFV